MDTLLFVGFLGLLALVPLSVVSLMVYLVGKLVGLAAGRIAARHPNKSKIARGAALATYSLLGGFVAYVVYDAVFPGDDFYFGEFRTVTLRPVPAEVIVEYKSASFPDHHGDYCSHSRMLLTEERYEALLRDLAADSRFLSTEINYQSTGPSNTQPPMHFVREFKQKDLKIDHRHAVRFASDGRHLEVQICVT